MRGSVGGGCINSAARGVAGDGRPFFVKTNQAAPPGMFSAEAAGLRALSAADGGCRVPAVLGVSDELGVLVLEWIESGSGGLGYAEALGRGLAAQHRVTREVCGFDAGDNYIGSTRQPNSDEVDWVVFFRDQRLGFQQELLRERGRMSRGLDRALDRVRERMRELLELPERPALLHGDLWGGNAMPGPSGEPVIYDPAAYFGCREADLAMTQLFGGFGPRFFGAYAEAFPLLDGYAERRDVYNLYHILNHANLFGGGYAAQAEAMARRFQ